LEITGRSVETLKYFMAKKWKVLTVVAILSFFAAFFESLSAVAIYPVLLVIMPASAVEGGSNKYVDAAIAWATAHSSLTPLYVTIIFLLAVTIIKIALNYGNSLLAWVVANNIFQETQIKMMSALLTADYQFLVNTEKGDLAFRLLTAPGYVSKVVNTIPLMLVELLKILMMMAVLFVVSPLITGILLVTSYVYYLITKSVAQNVSYGTGSGRAISASNQTIHAMNALKGIKSIRLHGAVGHWVELFSKEVRKFYQYALKDTLIGSIPSSLLELVYISFLCVMVLYYSGTKGGIIGSIPMLGVFAYSLLKIMPSLKQLSTYGMTLMGMLPNAEAAYIAIQEAEQRKPFDGIERLDKFSTSIDLKDLTFSYVNSKKPAVKSLNCSIARGEFIGIIGPSGSGKTTLLDLLAGLLSPTAGKILVEGKDLQSYSARSLSEHIGYVGQETFLFNDTIRANILFGRKEFDDGAIKKALAKADMLEFTESLPGGLDYILADDGMKISGGQRQRISIARAVLRDPEILFLDEATSALDHQTEENVMQTVLRLVRKEGKTVIFVTHRKSAIKDADRIIELRDGQIIEAVNPETIGELIKSES